MTDNYFMKKLISFILCFLLSLFVSYAQDFPGEPIQSIARQEIDAKRMDSNPFSSDALPRSREFKRIDSTYYVGWLFEGLYKQKYAADFLGYKNAIEPLNRALQLIEKDYKKQLKTRTSDLFEYYPSYKFHIDYSLIASALIDCYNNIEQPDEAYQIAKKVLKWNFQKTFYIDPYVTMSWIVHRNRFYKSKDYDFLKNSIAENEQLANLYLDSSIIKTNKDRKINTEIFQPDYYLTDYQRVYHYRAILYSYALNIDSADKYYQLLMESPYASYNNYGTYNSIKGQFKNAALNYEKASRQDEGDKRLLEWAYYSSILDIYKGKPNIGVENMENMIQAVGSTPGFGWYNIALARAESYDGDLESSERHALKAESFKEVHIGTTLGQSHYDFSVNLIHLVNITKQMQIIKFNNKGWWYNIKELFQLVKLYFRKTTLEYLIVNQLANNPERDKVIYTLFSTESTVTWDESWYLIENFSSSYFKKIFQKQLMTDERPHIKKYFQLNLARLEMKKGNYKTAKAMIEEILDNAMIDHVYEKLFLARCYESLSTCYLKLKNKNLNLHLEELFYTTYPQLVPFSKTKIALNLNVSGIENKDFIRKLKKYNIEWNEEPNAPTVLLDFKVEGQKTKVLYSVVNNQGDFIIDPNEYVLNNDKSDAAEVMKRLFYIGKINQSANETEQEMETH